MESTEISFFLICFGSITLVATLPLGAFPFTDDIEENEFYLPDRLYPSDQYHFLSGDEFQTGDGDIFFEDCFELTCHAGDYGGFGCRDGYCDYICEPDGCYETKQLKASGGSRATGTMHRQSHSRSDFIGHLEIFGRVDFDGCSEKHCRFGEYEGYACNEGICGYVCKGTMCRSRLKKLSEDENVIDEPDDYVDYDGEGDEYDDY
uniref:Uncharacterized protein n=1 Tax=Schistocephalus solidus TaxID=70667 RepID=A0A0X3NI47_SCHSO